jgi:thiol-disulfide isomerase/thioredoxin
MLKRLQTIGVAATILAAVLWSGPTRSDSKNAIRPIDMEQLDQMVKTTQTQCLITVMAAWCAPCIKELPDLNKLYIKYKDQGLKVIGITVDLEGPQAMQPIVDRLKIDFPIYWMGEKAIEALSISGIPLIMFVRKGKIVEDPNHRIKGRRSRKFLDKTIRKYLKDGTLPDIS